MRTSSYSININKITVKEKRSGESRSLFVIVIKDEHNEFNLLCNGLDSRLAYLYSYSKF